MFRITQKKLISGTGELADLTFTTASITDSTVSIVRLANWQFDAGCFRPVLLNGEVTGSAQSPHISASLMTLDFGEVQIATTKTDSITITNTGGSDLTITAQTIGGTDASDFGIIVSSPATLMPLQSAVVTLKFSPASTGSKTAAYHLATNDPGNPQFDVTLTGNSVTSIESDQPAPGAIVLEQNYPNPVSISGGTLPSIRFSLSAESFATLKLYDFLGRLIATIYEGKTSPGMHVVTIDRNALQLTPGVYLYTLIAGNRTLARTMLAR